MLLMIPLYHTHSGVARFQDSEGESVPPHPDPREHDREDRVEEQDEEHLDRQIKGPDYHVSTLCRKRTGTPRFFPFTMTT